MVAHLRINFAVVPGDAASCAAWIYIHMCMCICMYRRGPGSRTRPSRLDCQYFSWKFALTAIFFFVPDCLAFHSIKQHTRAIGLKSGYTNTHLNYDGRLSLAFYLRLGHEKKSDCSSSDKTAHSFLVSSLITSLSIQLKDDCLCLCVDFTFFFTRSTSFSYFASLAS